MNRFAAAHSPNSPIAVAISWVLLACWPGTGYPQAVESHLASMARQTWQKHAAAEFSADAAGQDETAERVRAIMQQAGVRYWRVGDTDQSGLEQVYADALGLDMENPEHWASLHVLLDTADRIAQEQQLGRIADMLAGEGKATSQAQLAAAFDQARSEQTKSLGNQQRLEVGENGDYLDLSWDPLSNQFALRVVAAENPARNQQGFTALMTGTTRTVTASDEDRATLKFAADDHPARVMSSDDLAGRVANLAGEWTETATSAHPDAVWTLTLGNPAAPDNQAQQDAAQEIQQLKAEINAIRNDRVFRWRDPASGEQQDQEKFRRLDEPWEYLGEFNRHPDPEPEIASRQARIEELQAGQEKLPLEQHDPVHMAESLRSTEAAEVLAIEFTNSSGERSSFDQALLEGGRITARRTLRKVSDIDNLPTGLVSELVRSWNPPEWIELDVRADPDTRETYLEGKRWRLHVTWSEFLGYDIESIHTPWSKPLKLVRSVEHQAEGAAAGVVH